jgi:hypothetical protein
MKNRTGWLVAALAAAGVLFASLPAGWAADSFAAKAVS